MYSVTMTMPAEPLPPAAVAVELVAIAPLPPEPYTDAATPANAPVVPVWEGATAPPPNRLEPPSPPNALVVVAVPIPLPPGAPAATMSPTPPVMTPPAPALRPSVASDTPPEQLLAMHNEPKLVSPPVAPLLFPAAPPFPAALIVIVCELPTCALVRYLRLYAPLPPPPPPSDQLAIPPIPAPPPPDPMHSTTAAIRFGFGT